MSDDVELTSKEKQLIRELTETIAEINSNNAEIGKFIFSGLASYVEGIKTGLRFQNNIGNNF